MRVTFAFPEEPKRVVEHEAGMRQRSEQCRPVSDRDPAPRPPGAVGVLALPEPHGGICRQRLGLRLATLDGAVDRLRQVKRAAMPGERLAIPPRALPQPAPLAYEACTGGHLGMVAKPACGCERRIRFFV